MVCTTLTAGICVLAQANARAQPSPRTEFEVATMRQSPPPAGDLIDINLGTLRNGRLTFANASLSDCLKFAWQIVSDDQISGPDWIKSKAVRFDIVAQVPPDTPRDQVFLMLQALLADPSETGSSPRAENAALPRAGRWQKWLKTQQGGRCHPCAASRA
jgi:hypothetical protein